MTTHGDHRLRVWGSCQMPLLDWRVYWRQTLLRRKPTMSLFFMHPLIPSRIFLLSLQAVLTMAIQEAFDLSAHLIRAETHGLRPEHFKRSEPELLQTIEHLRSLSCLIRSRLLDAAPGRVLSRAYHALTTYQFHQELSWNVDDVSVQGCLATISEFKELGFTGVSHVLHARLLQAKVNLTADREADVRYCWQSFAVDVARYLQHSDPEVPSLFKDLRLFTPQEIVRIPAVASNIRADGRLDFLGRSTFQVLYDAGVPINFPVDTTNHADFLGRTALHQALSRRDEFTISSLLRQNADHAKLCLNQLSALHISATQGHTSMVVWLISNLKHPVDALDALGRSPFWYAANNSHLSIARLLALRPDVDMYRKDHHGLSAFATAARDGRYDVLGYLYRLHREKTSKFGHAAEREVDHTPLILASQERRFECVDLILKKKSWVIGDENFEKLQHLANASGDAKLLQRLNRLWQVDGKEAFRGSQKPWPNARESQEPMPETIYTSNFNTKRWSTFHLTHIQTPTDEVSSITVGKANEF